METSLTSSPGSYAKQQPSQRQAQPARRLRYLPTQGRWNEPETAGLQAGVKLTCVGLALLAGFGLTMLFNAGDYAMPFFLPGSALLLTGTILLLLALGRSITSQIRRVRQHCGRCRFYQPERGCYALGRCGTAPGEPFVRRADTCPSFCYSQRAMVRERLAQRPDMLKQIRITRAG
jgi:hypothetical protein